MTRGLFIACMIALLISGNARTALGEDDAKGRASKLFKEGGELYKKGMYLDALEKFKTARSIFPSTKIDLNLASTLDALGRFPEAATYLERFMIQGKDVPDEMMQKVSAFMDRLKAKVASVTISSPVNGALVKVDGITVGTVPLAIPIYLSPGDHKVEMEEPNHEPLVRTLALEPGQHLKLDATLMVKGADMATRAGSTVSPISGADQTDAGNKKKSLIAYSALGAGAALALTAAVLYGVGVSKGDSAYEDYEAAKTQQERDTHYEDVQSAEGMIIGGHVMAGLAVAAVGVGVWALLTRPSADEELKAGVQSAPAAVLGFTPHGGAVLTFNGQF